MTKKMWLIGLLLVLLTIPIKAQNSKIQGYAEQGGTYVVTSGIASSTKFQASYPLSTITIYDTGTLNLSSIYSDSIGTPKSNPFTSTSTGYWFFYGTTGSTFDVKFSGTGIITPFTISGYVAGGGGGGGDSIGGSGTTNKIPKFTSSSNIGNSLLTDNGTYLNINQPTVNESAFASTGATVTLFNGADSSSGSPSTSLNPLAILQTWRNTGTQGIGQVYLGIASYEVGTNAADTYTVYALNKYNVNMSGFTGDHFQQGIRGYVVLSPTNLTSNLYAYGGWFQGETTVAGVRIVGAQIDANRNVAIDSNVSTGVIDSSFNIATNYTGLAHSTSIIYSQAFSNAVGAYAGWYVDPNATVQRILDFSHATMTLQGTWQATNGSTAVSGASGHADLEVVAGDYIKINGTYARVASSTANSITLSSNFTGSNGSGLTITKSVQTIWMTNNSPVIALDSGNSRKELVRLSSSNIWTFDADGETSNFGASVTTQTNLIANNGFTNKALIGAVLGQETYPGIWFGPGAISPTLSNYSFLFDPNIGETILNGTNAIELRIANAAGWYLSSSNAFTPSIDLTNSLGDPTHRIVSIYVGSLSQTAVLFAALGTPINGTSVYCSDCTNASNPCTGVSTGAIAKRLNGAWDCR